MVVLSEKEEIARSKVCLALDVSDLKEVERLVEELHELVGLYKIGMELYVSEGPKAIRTVKEAGGDVFLDLKFKDIPNTVRGAARSAAKHGVYMFNVHVDGGKKMMESALEGAREGAKIYGTRIPKVVGVTVLTSIDQETLNKELKIPGKVEDRVLHYAKLAEDAGLDGIVCAAADLLYVRPNLREDFMYITPGIKAPSGVVGVDQKRVYTPGKAIRDGASILVIGRAITKVKDEKTGQLIRATYDQMRENALAILKDMAQYL